MDSAQGGHLPKITLQNTAVAAGFQLNIDQSLEYNRHGFDWGFASGHTHTKYHE